MQLEILSINPPNGTLNTFLDIPIRIEFNQPIDPFTVKNGIGLYTIKKSAFGENPITIDTNYSEYINAVDDFLYYNYNYTLEGNTVVIHPIAQMSADFTYYITAFPGDNGERYVSKSTIKSVSYTRVNNSVGLAHIVTYFKGSNDTTYQLIINADSTFDVLKNNIFQDTITYVVGVPVSVDSSLGVSLDGVFSTGDIVSIECIPSEGLTSLYQTSFTTSKYVIKDPISQTIESMGVPLEILKTQPKHLSVNNQRCNPITITFSRTLDPEQDIANNIEITKRDFENGLTSNLTYYYKIMDNILRIYLIGVEH